jgi:hypothetical protein
MQNPLFVCLPLNLEIWNKIKITANNQGIEGSRIKIGTLINNVVHTHRLVLEHDVILGQKNQIDVAKSFLGKPAENVEFFRTRPLMPGNDGKIQIAVRSTAAGRQRPKKVNGIAMRGSN